MTGIKKAVIPVGGLGTRFLPATKVVPKEMMAIVDKPVIQYAVEEALEAGIEDILFITGRGKTIIEDHFDHSFELESILRGRKQLDLLETMNSALPNEGHFHYTRQKVPRGLGHAIWCARAFVGNEPFAILLPDDLIQCSVSCTKQMVTAYDKIGGNIIAVSEVASHETSKYGIIDPGEHDGAIVNVKGLVEKPHPDVAPSNLAITWRYILQPEIFSYLENAKEGIGNEIQLTDAMQEMIGTFVYYGLLFEGKRFDCGSRLGFLQANISYALCRDDVGAELKKYLHELLE